MASVLESVLSVCAVLVAAELISRLCPKNAVVGFVRALLALVLLLSVLPGLSSLEWDVSEAQQAELAGEELSAFVEERLLAAAGQDAAAWVKGLLASAGIAAEKIEPIADIEEDGSIVLKKVIVVFRYESEAERSRVLLNNVLGEETEVEIRTDGD